MATMKAVRGDITKLNVDAIVNAANSSLAGGGGVDGAIHRAAGPGLAEEAVKLAPCPTGEARLTGGHHLPAKHVIHTVGPVWDGGGRHEAELLANCYRHCLAIACRHGIKSIAFPAISTGIFGYPAEPAAEIAVAEVERFLRSTPVVEEVLFVCFDDPTFDVYTGLLNAINDR